MVPQHVPSSTKVQCYIFSLARSLPSGQVCVYLTAFLEHNFAEWYAGLVHKVLTNSRKQLQMCVACRLHWLSVVTQREKRKFNMLHGTYS